MKRLVAFVGFVALVATSCTFLYPDWPERAGAIEVEDFQWFDRNTGGPIVAGSRQPAIDIPFPEAGQLYPNTLGVKFLLNGVVANPGTYRPNGYDATGDKDNSVFHIWPNITVQNGDVLEARWQAPDGYFTSYHVVGGAAPTTTVPPTTTAAPTTTVAPPTTTTPSTSSAWFDDFEDPASVNDYTWTVDHRDSFIVSQTQWTGQHDENCGGPSTTRTILRSNPDDSFYWCNPGPSGVNGHVMTSIGDTAGYSIGTFEPNTLFSDVTEVRWDVNITDLGNRQWYEVKVLPDGSYDPQNPPCAIDWLAGVCGNTGIPQGGVAAAFHVQMQKINVSGVTKQRNFGEWWQPWIQRGDPALDTVERREHFLRDNGDGTITFGIQGQGGPTDWELFTTAGSFPDGPVHVLFADHNYTPLKTREEDGQILGPLDFTWHWDNVEVITSGGVSQQVASTEPAFCTLDDLTV